jgi:hypothetical protein
MLRRVQILPPLILWLFNLDFYAMGIRPRVSPDTP